jgi:hypothetical protein
MKIGNPCSPPRDEYPAIDEEARKRFQRRSLSADKIRNTHSNGNHRPPLQKMSILAARKVWISNWRT